MGENVNEDRQQTAQGGQTVVVNTVVERKGNGPGTAGFVFAILGIVVSWVPVVSWIGWSLGVLFSFIGLFKKPRGLAIAGIVLSFIDVIAILAIAGVLSAIL